MDATKGVPGVVHQKKEKKIKSRSEGREREREKKPDERVITAEECEWSQLISLSPLLFART